MRMLHFPPSNSRVSRMASLSCSQVASNNSPLLTIDAIIRVDKCGYSEVTHSKNKIFSSNFVPKVNKMKAVILKGSGGCENFELRNDFPEPVLKSSEVLVKIMSTGFNPIDYQMRRGDGESKLAKSPVLGREFSGVVLQVGSEVSSVKEGDRVFAASGSMGSNGTYAEYISVPESIIAKMPIGISFDQAAGIPLTYLTALQIYDRICWPEDKPLLIAGGAGGVGLALIKLLLHKGYQKIVTTFGNEMSRRALIEVGMPQNRLIDYHNGNLTQEILKTNQNRMLGLAIDLVGGRMAELCSEVLAMNGIYVDVTALSTEIARSKLFDKGAQIINVANYTPALFGQFGYYGVKLGEIAKMIESKQISPPSLIVLEGLSASAVSKGHELMEQNRTGGAKVVLKVALI